MTTLAIISVSLAVGTWWGIRWAEAGQRLDRDLNNYLLSIPQSEWDQTRWDTEVHRAVDADRWRWN